MIVGPPLASSPPLIESDYCYQLIAADRWVEGLGFTSLQPSAPRQPWEWRYDFGFLTQWPAGYPLLVGIVRTLTGSRTVEACRWISLLACATAFAGWFLWIKRSVPGGRGRVLLGLAGGLCAVPLSSLVNPSTDALLAAVLPIVLLLVQEAIDPIFESDSEPLAKTIRIRLLIAGLLAGGLIWIRYAAIFVPVAVLTALAVDRMRQGRTRTQGIIAFSSAAAVPIAALWLTNRWLGPTLPLQAQLNLGTQTAFHFSWELPVAAWWRLTDLHCFASIPRLDEIGHWCFALSPLILLGLGLTVPTARKIIRSLSSSGSGLLSVMMVGSLLLMLILATSLFGDKFQYVYLDRYYLPVKPLLFVLIVSPLLLLPFRITRWGSLLALLWVCSFVMNTEWRDGVRRAKAGRPETTEYGRRANCFTPGADALFQWVRGLDPSCSLVFSNFHDYVTLETGLPSYPLPSSEETLRDCVSRVCTARGIGEPRVYFVLDVNNRWRSHWLPAIDETIARFGLMRRVVLPSNVSAQVFERTDERSITTAVLFAR